MTLKRTFMVLASLLLYGIIIYLVYLWVMPYPYKIINHEKPNIDADFSVFRASGCKPFSGDWYQCEEGSPLFDLGCTYVVDNPLLGGLTPNYPVTICVLQIDEMSWVADIPDECFYHDGNFLTFCYRSAIYKDDSFQLLGTWDEFRTFYAPIDSPEEALSYVLVNDNFVTNYEQTRNSDYVYSVRELEDSHVISIADGYLVHVFQRRTFGCGPFETEAVEIKVTFDGTLEEVDRYPVYRDPSEDNMCVD